MRIHELLRNKGFHVITVRPERHRAEVIEPAAEYNLGAVVVSADGRQVSGIVTERDIVRRLADGTDFLDRTGVGHHDVGGAHLHRRRTRCGP